MGDGQKGTPYRQDSRQEISEGFTRLSHASPNADLDAIDQFQ